MNKLFRYIVVIVIFVPGVVVGMYLGEVRILHMIQQGKLGIACTK